MPGITCEAAYWDRDRQKRRLSWIQGLSLVKRGVTGCFYRLSHGVMAEEASLEKWFHINGLRPYRVYKTPGIPHEPFVKLATSSMAAFDSLTW